MYLFFFFQAEDGIRDGRVTGVQTCALPILPGSRSVGSNTRHVTGATMPKAGRCAFTGLARAAAASPGIPYTAHPCDRSEERRVGKEGRSQWSTNQYKNKKHGQPQLPNVQSM